MTAEQKAYLELIRAATKVKNKFQSTVHRCVGIIDEITRGENYTWAKNNPEGDVLISQACDHVRLSLTYVQKDFVMSSDLGAFKKKHEQKVISYELGNFNKKEAELNDLEQKVNNFLQANEAMIKFKGQNQSS